MRNWNCRAGFTRFSGHGTHSARKMQLYCGYPATPVELRVECNHLRAIPACSCAQTMCPSVNIRRTPHAGCMRTSEAAPCMHPRNICKYTYTCTSGTWSTLRICMSTTAYARTFYVYTYIVRTHTEYTEYIAISANIYIYRHTTTTHA